MTFKEIITHVSKELDIPEHVITLAYRTQFQFIRSKISELEFKEGISEEEFNKHRVSFNLPTLGKLYTTYDDVISVFKTYEYFKKLKNENSKNDNSESNSSSHNS